MEDTIFRETRYKFRRMNLRDKILTLAKLKFGDDTPYEQFAGDMNLTREQVLKLCNMNVKRLCITTKIYKNTRNDKMKFGR